MIIENSEITGKEVVLAELELAMEEVGFLRWAWDYNRATYDYKYVDRKTGDTFYIRIPAEVIEGTIEDTGHAIVKLGQPYIGKHLHPHGLDYDFDFPKHVLNRTEEKLQALNSLMD